MRMPTLTSPRRVLLAVATLATVVPAVPGAAAAPRDGRGDATVIAVIDSAFSPYHYDFLASRMPQARNRDRSDDLPLTTSPDRWLPGFPKRTAFGSFQALGITLPSGEAEAPNSLYRRDRDKWQAVRSTTDTDPHYYWLPGTKVVGALTFSSTGAAPGVIHGTTDAHGTGTASVSVGNLHGTCPECLLVFIQYADDAAGERAIDWAMKQPWIDAISNSYGFGPPVEGRSRIYNGSNTALQRAATQRGQTIFFSAGNGVRNSFTVPNTTLASSQEGPDWIVTVTATDPNGGTYTGSGKPADVSGIGAGYPSAYGADGAGERGPEGFGGTSNATPTVAGTYARALYLARRLYAGPSRVQSGGLIARGSYDCGTVRRSCELAHGLTAGELRARLLQSAVSTGKGFTDANGAVPPGPQAADTRYAAEGHGTYVARLHGDSVWRAEFDRLWLPMLGTATPPPRPAGEREWFVVDSWCRQHIWGEWSGGYYTSGNPLPPDDPLAPTRTAYRYGCEPLRPPP